MESERLSPSQTFWDQQCSSKWRTVSHLCPPDPGTGRAVALAFSVFPGFHTKIAGNFWMFIPQNMVFQWAVWDWRFHEEDQRPCGIASIFNLQLVSWIFWANFWVCLKMGCTVYGSFKSEHISKYGTLTEHGDNHDEHVMDLGWSSEIIIFSPPELWSSSLRSSWALVSAGRWTSAACFFRAPRPALNHGVDLFGGAKMTLAGSTSWIWMGSSQKWLENHRKTIEKHLKRNMVKHPRDFFQNDMAWPQAWETPSGPSNSRIGPDPGTLEFTSKSMNRM